MEQQNTFLNICPHLAVNTPFVENNDGARLQMAASQCRQAVPLIFNETPMVQTTFENSWIFEPDIIKTKNDGIVIFKSNKVILVKYTNNEWDLFRIFYDFQVKKEVTNNYEFKKDEILAYKDCYFDEDGTLAQGKNLLVAVMSHPDTYEDAIVISKSFAQSGALDCYEYGIIEKYISENDILLSINKNDIYKALPKIGDIINSGESLLRIKHYSKKIENLLYDSEDIILPYDVEIVDVDVVPYKFNNEVREFTIKMKEIQYDNVNMIKYLQNKDIPEKYIYKIKQIHNLFDYKKEVTFNKKKLDSYIKIIYKTIITTHSGDKFSNRHANKGVVSKLLEDKYMPMLPDGRRVQVIINPMSIISRMNIGQLYELAASNCIYELRKRINESNDLNEIKNLIKSFYSIIDNTKDNRITNRINNILHEINSIEELKVIKDNFIFPAPPFECSSKEQIIKGMELLNVSDLQKAKYRDKEIEVNIGYMYFYRLMHIASHKISGRSIGSFSGKTYQPVGGRQHGGGQKMGEMEIWSLISYNAINNIKESITLKSDDISQKLNYIYKTLYNIKGTPRNVNTESFKLLQSYLAVLGVQYEE